MWIVAIKNACLGFLVVAVAGIIQIPNTWPLAIFFQSLPFSLYVIIALVTAFMAIVWLRKIGIALAFLVLGGSWIVAAAEVLTRDASSQETMAPLTVITWNTEYWAQHRSAKDFVESLQYLEADILTLQEHINLDPSTGSLVPIDQSDILKTCCDFEHVWTKGELVIASRLPGELVPVNNDFILAVAVNHNGQQVTIIDVHMPVHVDLTRTPFETYFWTYLAEQNKRRLQITTELKALISSSEAAIIGRDFNSTILMPSFRKTLLRETDMGLSDLWPPTYPAGSKFPELWRLDFILGKNSGDRHCQVLRPNWSSTSDHRPVQCTFGAKI